MKIRLLIIILLAFAISKTAVAQQEYELFTAKEGLEFLATEMPEGLNLAGIITVTNPDSPIPVDLNTGQAGLWIYLYQYAESPTQGTMLILFKIEGAFFIFPGEELEDLPEDLKTISDDNWINSDAMISSLNYNNTFVSYLSNNPEILSIQFMLAYAVSEMSEVMPPQFLDRLIWMVFINEDLQCFVDALTSETVCVSASTAVNELAVNSFIKAYPQPATDLLEITLSENTTSNKVEIYSIFGQLALEFVPTIDNNVIRINTSTLNAGTYFVKIYDGVNVNTKKISIIK